MSSPLHFTELLACDVFRDGGSLEATLRTSSGDVLSLALEIDHGSYDTARLVRAIARSQFAEPHRLC